MRSCTIISRKISLLVLWIVITIVVCATSPFLDQQLAILPYDSINSKFYGEVHWWCSIIYYGVNVATVLLIAIPLFSLLYVMLKKLPLNKTLLRIVLVSYLGLAIGPGLVVNLAFKNNWGRARPYQVIRDHHPFSYPWQPHFDRPADNSFPSGHVSIGAFVGVPLIAARRKKLGVLACGIGFVLVGIVRWLQGGHYFTDIVMAGVLVWLCSWLVMMIVDRVLSRNGGINL